MTKQQATQWVRGHDDGDDLDEEELESAWLAIMGRPADGQDRAEGLWSHLCAAI
jgi:hypothetical protein